MTKQHAYANDVKSLLQDVLLVRLASLIIMKKNRSLTLLPNQRNPYSRYNNEIVEIMWMFASFLLPGHTTKLRLTHWRIDDKVIFGKKEEIFLEQCGEASTKSLSFFQLGRCRPIAYLGLPSARPHQTEHCVLHSVYLHVHTVCLVL